MNGIVATLVVACSALSIGLIACKTRQPESQVRQIFYTPGDSERGDISQRKTAKPEDFPFAITVANLCTGFLISPDLRIAMTATHCGIKTNDRVCLGPQSVDENDCKVSGIVTEIIESSRTYQYDYAILRIGWTQPLPKEARHLSLETRDTIKKLKDQASQAQLVGYPADKYAKGLLTVSRCRLRSDLNEVQQQQDPAIINLVKRWQSDRQFYNDPEYQSMREDCSSFTLERRTFRADCSVYGGNSGGPLIDASSGNAIGMPSTYYPETYKGGPCYTKYWTKFFWPIWYPDDKEGKFREPPEAKNYWADRWDQLDREKSPIEDIPEFIPIFEIVRDSKFINEHAQDLGISIGKGE